MKRIIRKLKNRQGLTMVEMLAAVAVLALLTLILNTGLLMAQKSYYEMTGEAESQLLLSTLTDLLSNELRYARDVEVDASGNLTRYTSANYGRNITLALNASGQLEANERLMLSTGAYGNGAYRIQSWNVTYLDGLFTVKLEIKGTHGVSNQTEFSVRCLNATA
ncbi:MAG: prepilin-type N-terminal cleavage/methylation domain-containing protein [Butyricicoccus sp.]|nr:prepilin-type N-terminal cleavage/methylation domain-containing protein [Butyricicoccus sp.]